MNKETNINKQDLNNENITFAKTIGFGIGGMGVNFSAALVSGFVMYFFTDMLGISAAIAGTIMLASRLFDGISDIIVGSLVDKTHSKYGKARPWLIFTGVPLTIALALLFTVPDLSMTGRIIWAVVTYNLVTTVCFTSINVPYLTLNSLITDNAITRSKISVAKTTFTMLSTSIISASTLAVVEFFGGDARAWQITAVVYGILLTICMAIVFFSTKEKVQIDTSKKLGAAGEKVSNGFKILFKNKYWVLLVILAVVVYINASTRGATVYFCKYVLKDLSKQPMIVYAGTIPTIIAVLFLMPFVKRWGKRNVSLAGMGINIIGCIVMILGAHNYYLILLGSALKGIGQAGLTAFLHPMFADVITYGRWKFGHAVAGKGFSGASFGQKFGNGFGSALTGWILAWGGYNAALPTQSASSLMAINGIYLVLPLVCGVIIMIILSFYSLDKIYPQVVEELKQRDAAPNN